MRLIFILALLIRLPLIGTNWYKTPDAVEYLNIARHLAAGENLISSLKFNYLDSSPVVHPAITDRPLGWPVFLSFLLRLSANPIFSQTVILFLGAANAALIYRLFLRYLNHHWAFLGGVLYALNPNLLITNRLLLAEPLGWFLALIGLNLFLALKIKPIILAGILLVLAYLTRPELLFLILTLTIYLILNRPRLLPGWLLTILITAAPYHWQSLRQGLGFFPFVESRVWQVLSFPDALGQFELRLTPPLTLFKQQFNFILSRWLVLGWLNLKQIFSFGWLGPLAITIIFVPKKFLLKTWPLVLFGLIILALSTLTWPIFPEPERTLTPVFIVLLLLILKSLSKIHSSLAKPLLLITIIIYLVFDSHRLLWARKDPANHLFPANQEVITWINQNTNADDIIAAADPWTINYATGRPSLILPRDLTRENFGRFITRYQPKYFVIYQDSPLKYLLPAAVFSTTPPDQSIYRVKAFD
jgi:hypothetical protein